MFHYSAPVTDWPRAVTQLPAGYVIKAIDNVQMLSEAKAVNPGVKTILRHWYQNQAPGDTLEDNKNRARVFFDSFIDGTFMDGSTCGVPHTQVDYVEEWNEYFGNSQTPEDKRRFTLWAQAAAEVWADEYRIWPDMEHIRLILANTAIGNDIPVEVAQIAVDNDCLIGYHPYWPVKNDVVPADEWQWYSGRWAAMDQEYRNAGYTAQWAFTEAGAVRHWGDWPDIGLDPMGGWKHPDCHNGDIRQYLITIERWMNHWHAWNEQHGDRALPPVLFDSRPNPAEWQHFQIWQPDMDTIASFVRQWQPVTPPPPPPPERGKPRIQYHRAYNVIPQDATEERAVDIFRQGWRESKQTSGGSYDDAGIGDLDNRTAIVWDEPEAKHEEILDWFTNNYPGVHVEFREGDISFFLHSPVDGIPLYISGHSFNTPRPNYPSWTNRLHEGLDLRAVDDDWKPVPIVAMADGTVIWASELRRSNGLPSDYGNHVIVEHDNGLTAWYCHLGAMTVQPGETVLLGDMLGIGGDSGNSDGVHLHLNIQDPINGLSGYIISDVVDPAPLLGL